jgi:hypothetical protein
VCKTKGKGSVEVPNSSLLGCNISSSGERLLAGEQLCLHFSIKCYKDNRSFINIGLLCLS